MDGGSPPRANEEIYHPNLHTWHPQYMECVRFFLDHGQHTVPVQSLSAFINLRLPYQRVENPVVRSSTSTITTTTTTNTTPPISLRMYVRRLIVTAHDTPLVLSAFFGPNWQAGVGSVCAQERINYLFTAKSEGWVATKAAYDVLPDEQTPFLRPLLDPTEEELRTAESRWSEWLAMEDWMVGPRSPW
ncbi:hypothetical protein FE257_000417 [Aspergillus nanangensis]|uniref:Uncharacterized protein n=1 Tax=Aspergillus nanangensis TaxID=2582783 RepID=A0AAD4GYP0_ASPNN|nr:hypothetical protein FE257_000417 [Aspergillus nanangensis]